MIPGRGWFSPFAACFRGGATIFRPYHSCAPVPLTYEEREVKTIFSVNPTFSLKGIPSCAPPL
jgi:hypothetical protein